MRTRVRNPFTTVQTSGLLLPVDLLARIVDGDPTLAGADTRGLSSERRRAAERGRRPGLEHAAWQLEGIPRDLAKLPATDQGTTLTRDKWLLPLFRELGYGWLQANKRSLEIDGKPYPVSHQWQGHIAHASRVFQV